MPSCLHFYMRRARVNHNILKEAPSVPWLDHSDEAWPKQTWMFCEWNNYSRRSDVRGIHENISPKIKIIRPKVRNNRQHRQQRKRKLEPDQELVRRQPSEEDLVSVNCDQIKVDSKRSMLREARRKNNGIPRNIWAWERWWATEAHDTPSNCTDQF